MLQLARAERERASGERIDALTQTISVETGFAPFQPVALPPGLAAEPLVQTVATCLEDAKAEDIVPLDLHGKTTLADAMIIATGRSATHVGAIAERLIGALKTAGAKTPRVQGMPNNDWVLIDAGDIIVHIFRPEVRQFYNLEKIWGGDRPDEKSGERAARAR